MLFLQVTMTVLFQFMSYYLPYQSLVEWKGCLTDRRSRDRTPTAWGGRSLSPASVSCYAGSKISSITLSNYRNQEAPKEYLSLIPRSGGGYVDNINSGRLVTRQRPKHTK